MKRTILVAAASLFFATAVLAQPQGMGPGVMGGHGPGGYGMGPGMMGGYGPGGYGMGPGMMGGYGPGGYGMGPGMMWRQDRGIYQGLGLTAEQSKKIDQIQEETAKARWALMGTMHQQGFHMHDMFGPGPLDEQEARKAFQAMSDAQKAMFDLHLDARKRINAVLTKEQREKLSGK
jgi:Spy/CpxP family protein refolding chaperone